jgi:hypothetical protein
MRVGVGIEQDDPESADKFRKYMLVRTAPLFAVALRRITVPPSGKALPCFSKIPFDAACSGPALLL